MNYKLNGHILAEGLHVMHAHTRGLGHLIPKNVDKGWHKVAKEMIRGAAVIWRWDIVLWYIASRNVQQEDSYGDKGAAVMFPLFVSITFIYPTLIWIGSLLAGIHLYTKTHISIASILSNGGQFEFQIQWMVSTLRARKDGMQIYL